MSASVENNSLNFPARAVHIHIYHLIP